MLHLENFFEKSFALLLTTPKKVFKLIQFLYLRKNYDMLHEY